MAKTWTSTGPEHVFFGLHLVGDTWHVRLRTMSTGKTVVRVLPNATSLTDAKKLVTAWALAELVAVADANALTGKYPEAMKKQALAQVRARYGR